MKITIEFETTNKDSVKEAFNLVDNYLPDNMRPQREPIIKTILLQDSALPARVINSLRSFGLKTINELKELDLGKTIMVPQKIWDYETRQYKEESLVKVSSIDDLGKYAKNFGPNSIKQIRKYIAQII